MATMIKQRGSASAQRESLKARVCLHFRDLSFRRKTAWFLVASMFFCLRAAQDTKRLSSGPPPMQIPSSNRELVTEVSGGFEAQYFFQRIEKAPGWDQNLGAICELKQKSILLALHRLEENLAGLKTQNLEDRHFETAATRHHTVGQLHAYQGNLEEAIEHFEAALRIAISHGLRDFELDLRERLGIAHLRRGEVDNCVKDRHASSCIFPIDLEGQHELASGSQTAVEHFLKFLELMPNDLEVKWLLNIAYMTLGKYPQGVPKQYLISPAVFESKEDIGRFRDVANQAGVDTFGQAGGAVMDDFDNDGFLDLVTSSLNPCEPLQFFHNQGNGKFSNRTASAKLSEQLGGLNLNQADYNNDGWLDLYVLRGGWDVPMRNSLLKNNGDGTFSDVTEEANLARPATATQTAAWADFDNDGNLDLFVANENAPCQLFRNNGNGRFTDVAHRAGVDQVRFAKGVTAGDYDNDGYPDYYVSNGGDDNFLYHNNRDGTFSEVARKLGVEKPSLSFATWFFDYDNDGWLDLFVTSFLQSVKEVAASYLKLPGEAETLRLYRNMGGSFKDVTHEVGLDRVFMPMGCNFGDVDNDGYLDFYLGTGAPSYAALVPNVLFRNHDGRYFVDITTSSGTGHLQKGHGIAFGDIDNDGDQDIFVKIGGAVPGDKYASALFRNPGRSEHPWLAVQLVGRKTNRLGVGARLKVTIKDRNGQLRSIHREVTSGGSFGASPLQQHIGLGTASDVDTLEIWWPVSQTRQVFNNVRLNQTLKIKEFERELGAQKRHSFLIAEPTGKDSKSILIARAPE